MKIEINKDVKEYIKKRKKDFRICTSCFGASQPKETDIRIKIEKQMLYISAVQARWLRKIDKKMLDTDSCSLFE